MSTRHNHMSIAEQRIGYRLKIAQHLLRQRLDAELASVEITAPQFAILLSIANNPGVSNASLARTAFVTPQSMQGLLANLERAGLIRRTPHPEHGRIIQSELTDKGIDTVAAATLAADAVEQLMLAHLNETESQQLADLLSKCATALGWTSSAN